MTESEAEISIPGWWQHPDNVWQELIGFLRQQDRRSLSPEFFQAICEQKNWSVVEGGITNFNYKLDLPEQCFFVQVLDADKIVRLPNKQFVPVNQVMAKNPELQKWLIPCLHDTQSLRVFEWIDATNTSLELLHKEQLIESLCEFLSVLHANISVLPILNIKQHLKQYYDLAMSKNPHKEREYQAQLASANRYAESFIPSKNCHNDLSPGNILFTNQDGSARLVVVDWEYACISDPLFDIAGICINFDFDVDQQKHLLARYSEIMGHFPNWQKFKHMKALYQLVASLWSA